MDSTALVTDRQVVGERFLTAFGAQYPVATAFWYREPESADWRLFVASDKIDGEGLRDAYAEARRATNRLNDPDLDPLRLRLAGLWSPEAVAVLARYRNRAPTIPFRTGPDVLGNTPVEEAYFFRGPTREYAMPNGRETLERIIDEEAAFFQKHGRAPRKLRLPILMAYDLSKCSRELLGDAAARVFLDGVVAFEKQGFHGMTVEIIRDRNAALEFE